MTKIIQKVVWIVILLSLTLSANEAILSIDTQGHKGLINDIIVTKSGDIISASDDKTIRVWDSKTGKEKRKILGQIGAGLKGMIYTIALSNDERFLAVGGFLDNPDNDGSGQIRLYDYNNGILLKLLKSHTNVVNDLAFSSDGNYLLSGSADKTIKLWDLSVIASATKQSKNGSPRLKPHDDERDIYDDLLVRTIPFHINFVDGVKFVELGNKRLIVSAGYDNKVAIHSLDGTLLNSYTHSEKLMYIATKEDEIAVCGDGNEILIFDTNLNLKTKIKSETIPIGLAYSPNGRYLLAGQNGTPGNVNIYDTTKNHSKISTFTKHTNATIAVGFLDNDTAISGGGSNNEIYLWDIKNPNIVKQSIIGSGKSVWSVGINGESIAWGNIGRDIHNTKSWQIEKSFDLMAMSLRGGTTKQSTKDGSPRLKPRDDDFTRINSSGLTHSVGGDYGYSDAVLTLPNGTTITKDAYTGYNHRCYGWYKEWVVSGGKSGLLQIYNQKGEIVANLVGHTGEVWSIALEGDTLVSGSSDQTINIWDVNNVSKDASIVLEAIKKDSLADLAGLKVNDRILKIDDIKFNSMEEFSNYLSKKKKYNFLILRDNKILNITINKDQDKFGFSNSFNNIYPKLSLFVGNDNEWVAWTKEGFFDASPNGAKYIGYHINKGSDKAAEFVSVDKLYKSFYRPDLVQKALKGESLDSYAKDINIQEILKGGLAPVVAIKTQSGESNKRDVELELEVCQKDGGYDNLTLYLNGMAVSVLDTNRALKAKSSNSYLDCVAFKPLISLTNGENKIGFKATNKAGTIESNLAEISLGYKSNIATKPNLHILAIGVDKYRDGDLQLKYSVADAKELTKSLEKNGKKLFDKVYTYELLDGEVTKEKILSKFSEVGAKTTREDVFVFYMAGHGITDAKTGAYFYLPSDFRYKNDESVRSSGVSQEDFTLALSKIQALKSITLIDTCNSGSFAEALASRGVLQKTAIDKLTRATGRATLVASSKDQVALEGYKGHGVFTYTMMEALDGKAYKDGKITIKGLAGYIEDVLPERTYQKWGYEQVPQSHITGTDFPIGVK